MTIGQGIEKEVRFKKETTFGTAESASGAQLLRRVSSTVDLNKGTYQSNEIATHQQDVDVRHGVRLVGGAISCELSVGTFEEFLAAALRKAWAAGSSTIKNRFSAHIFKQIIALLKDCLPIFQSRLLPVFQL